jgi:glutaryl-CoA dehydrogenase (non-decarboxylating)
LTGPPAVNGQSWFRPPHDPIFTFALIDDRLQPVIAALRPGLEQRFIDGTPDPHGPALLARSGLLGLTQPRRYGGLGQDYLALGYLCERLGALDLSYQITVTVHLALSAMTILQWGTDRQRQQWLPSLATGDEIATFALTEPGAGSDVAAASTRAKLVSGGFRLSGEKTWISGANDSSLLLVFASMDPSLCHRGLCAFVVGRDAPGLATPALHGKLGIRAGDTGSVILDDVFVPEANLLGEAGEGFAIALSALATGLFTVGYGALGIAAECLAIATALLAEPGAAPPAGQHQLDHQVIAQMVSREAAARALLTRAAELKNLGRPSQQATSLAKWTASEGAVQNAEAALQLAQERQRPEMITLERHLRNAKGAVIYGGTSEIHQTMQAAYATGDRTERPFRRPALTAADLAGSSMPR